MNFNLTPEEKAKIEKQNQFIREQFIKSGRTREEVEALFDLSRKKALSNYKYQALNVGDIFEIPTLDKYENFIIEEKTTYGIRYPLLCNLENSSQRVAVYMSHLYFEIEDINKEIQRSEIIGINNLVSELENIKGTKNKIQKLCELAGGQKFKLENKKEIVPLDKSKPITSVYKFILVC